MSETQNVDDVIQQLVDDGLLTERQAVAYVLRDIEATPREAVADDMGISPNTLDNTLRAARDKVESAERTIETINAVRFPDLPANCSECGSTLGGAWAETDDAEALCSDCAGVDLSL